MPQQNILEFFCHLQWLHMSMYLYHLDRASGFLAHTLLVYTWIWVTPGFQQENGGGLGCHGSWSISLFQASQNLPGRLLSDLCLLYSCDSDWDECHADLLPVFWRLYAPGAQKPLSFSLEVPPSPYHQQLWAQRSPYGALLNDRNCTPVPPKPRDVIPVNNLWSSSDGYRFWSASVCEGIFKPTPEKNTML